MNTELAPHDADRSPSPTQELSQFGGWMQRIEQHPDWPLLSRLPIRLAAGVPLSGFTIAGLLALKAGQVIESAWPTTQDIGLKVGSVQLCWTEFEVVEQRMAVRLTRLA